MREPLVQFLIGIQHEPFSDSTLFDLSHESGVLVSLEQSRHLSVG